MKSNRIEDALAALVQGRMVVVVDDEDREDEGDLILAAEHATPERLAFMVRHSSGVICVGLPGERLDTLNLPLMVARNTESLVTAYTVTVDYRHGTRQASRRPTAPRPFGRWWTRLSKRTTSIDRAMCFRCGLPLAAS